MNPQRYGWQHLTYIAVIIVFSVLVFVLGKKICKKRKGKNNNC